MYLIDLKPTCLHLSMWKTKQTGWVEFIFVSYLRLALKHNCPYNIAEKQNFNKAIICLY